MQHPRNTRTYLASIFSFLTGGALLLPGAHSLAAQVSGTGASQNHLTPVHLWVAGRTLPLRVSPMSDGHETYVPLTAFAAAGAEFRLISDANAVHVTARSGRQADIPLVQVKSVAMVALSALATVLDASIGASDQWPGDRPNFRSSDTVYLLAHITGARFENGALRVRTSFPVPFHARMVAEVRPVRGYVDCVGAELPENFRPRPISDGESGGLRIRAAQNSPTIARVVMELPDGATLRTGDTGSAQEVVVQAIGVRTSAVASAGAARRLLAQSPPVPRAQDGQRGGSADGNGRQADRSGDGDGQDDHADGPAPAAPGGDSQDQGGSVAIIGGENSSSSHPVSQPITVRGLNVGLDNPGVLRFDVTTGARVRPVVRYGPGTTQMLVDIPNSQLALPDGEEHDRTLNHPLISGLRIETIAGGKAPLTRLTLDTARILGYSVNVEQGSFSLELRVPRNATGALADKLIVVDAGHGGSATGARSAGICEKDCTLGIALRLRSELESCGARVVMTRTTDADVSLSDRCRMGNEIGADLFISIHNDSNERSNSASGTSTYFHNSEPSSRALAACVQHAVMNVTGLPSRGILSDTVMYNSGFAVLRGSAMPAVLCEVAYINNQADRRKLVDPQFQHRVAKAMCDGLRSYVEGKPASTSRISARPTATDSGDAATGSPGS